MVYVDSEYRHLKELQKNNGKVQEDISKFDKQLRQHNKEHATKLSYGQFEGMLYLQSLKCKRKKRG